VEGLEDEPDLLVADPRERRSVKRVTGRPASATFLGGHVEQTDHVEERALPEPDGPITETKSP
jgi:hypothetical protein